MRQAMLRKMLPAAARKNRSERGFIIVAVLWIMAAISALVLVYSAYVSTTAVTVGDGTARIQDQALLTGAIELACYRLLSGDASAQRSGRFSGRIGAARLSVSYVSEAARIDLNQAPKDTIKGLLRGFGEADGNADEYASRIVAWRSPAPAATGPNANTEDLLYASAGLDYVPRHAAFAHIDELRLVRGIPKHIVGRMLPFVTVYSGRPAINIVEAEPAVIAALPRMTPQRLEAILSAREGQGTPRDLLALAAESRDIVTADATPTKRIAITVDYAGGRRISSEVVVRLVNGGTEPYRLLSRQDKVTGDLAPALP